MKDKTSKQASMSRESHFNMAPRIMTPNRLTPPNPMTIALSDALVLLQSKTTCMLDNGTQLQNNYYQI